MRQRVSTHIACDSAMTKSYHKSCGHVSMQGNDESHNLDASVTTTKLLKQSSSLLALKDASSLSQGSTTSSGYCSDTNLCDPPREETSATKVIQQQGSSKHRTSLDRDSRGSSSRSNDGPTMNMSKNSNCTNYENCIVDTSSSKQYENFSPPNLACAPPLPPKPVQKAPHYENQPLVFNHMKANSKLPSNSFSSTSSASHEDYSAQMLSTCEPVSPNAEKLSR